MCTRKFRDTKHLAFADGNLSDLIFHNNLVFYSKIICNCKQNVLRNCVAIRSNLFTKNIIPCRKSFDHSRFICRFPLKQLVPSALILFIIVDRSSYFFRIRIQYLKRCTRKFFSRSNVCFADRHFCRAVLYFDRFT